MARKVDASSDLLGGVCPPYAHPSPAPTLQLFPDPVGLLPVNSFAEGQASVLSLLQCSALGLAHSNQLTNTNEWVSDSLSYRTQR